MPRPRTETVSSTEPGVYHCHSGFTQGFQFMGHDPVCGQFCGHRRQWVIDRCRRLERTFPVEVLSLSVRAHRYDMVIHFDPGAVRSWSDRQVVERWSAYYILRKDEANKRRPLTEDDFVEILGDRKQVAQWRERLCHLGEFMQELNGRVASRINRENCGRGSIWASRYEAVALLDEVAVLTCIVNTELSGVELGSGGTVRVSPYSTLSKRMRPTSKGWEAVAGSLQREFSHDVLPSLKAEVLFIVLSTLSDLLFRPNLLFRDMAIGRLDPHLGPLIADVGLWVYEWLEKKDLPKRAMGAPALLAALAMKLGIKRLNLAWLGNGIYPGTDNEKERRAQRTASSVKQVRRKSRGIGKGCDPPFG